MFDHFHFHVELVAALSYLTTMVACAAGLFYSEYKDNWLQTIGMVLVGATSGIRLHEVFHHEWVSAEGAALALGTALFATGVAWKVWQHQRYLPRKNLFS